MEASEAEIEGALEGLPIAPEQLEMAEESAAHLAAARPLPRVFARGAGD